jgi:hypothetical protein
MKSKLLLATLCVLAPVTAMSQGSPEPPPEERRAASFLNLKQEAQSRFATALAGRADLPALNALVRAVAATSISPRVPVGPEVRKRLQESFYQDVSLELAALGHGPGDVRGPGGEALVRAAANKVRGVASLQDLVTLADTVVVGRVESVELANQQTDSFGGTLRLAVTDVRKGRVKTGETLSVRLRSGQIGPRLYAQDTEEYVPARGALVFLVGSRASYEPLARFRGRGPGTGGMPVVKLADLMDVNGSALKSHDPQLPDANLNDLRY